MDTTPPPPNGFDDWLASGPHEGEPPARSRRWLTAAGLLAAGLVAGGAGALLLGGQGTSTTQLQPVAGQGAGGPGGGAGAPGGGAGGMAGEQRVSGTLSGVGASTVTVSTGSGSQTYAVTSSTQIVQNGQQVTLADLTAGEPVFLHVYTLDGRMLVERLFAGTPPAFPGGPGPGPGQGAPPGAQPYATQPPGVVTS